MSDYRSKAEDFVINFLRHVNKEDILDHFDKARQKMVRSPGIEALIKEAREVFPPQLENGGGKEATDALTPEQVDSSIEESPHVLDRRDVFARKIQENGAARGLLRRVLDGDTEAAVMALELFAADDGETKFRDDK